MPKTSEGCIRWAIQDDVDALVTIDTKLYNDPWTKKEFTTCITSSNVIGHVVSNHGKIYAYLFYMVGKKRFSIINFGVCPEYGNKQHAEALIYHMKEKVDFRKNKYLEFNVSEDSLPIHVFLRENNFKAVGVKKNHFGNRDGYRFIYDPFLLRQTSKKRKVNT